MADGGLLWFNIGLSPRRGGTPDFVNFYIDKGDMALQTVSFQRRIFRARRAFDRFALDQLTRRYNPSGPRG
jgi:hypothetical protein